MHNTHKPRIGQFISIDAPNLSLCFSLQSQTNTAQTYPSITLAAAYPKPKKVHYKIKLQRSNATKSTTRNLYPSPMAITYCHRSSQDHTRPCFSGAWICHLISYLQKTILFTSLPKLESRLSGLSPFAVTYGYASMSMQLDLEMWGIVSRVSLGCCCVVRQNRNQMNIDAQQNTTAKTCAL